MRDTLGWPGVLKQSRLTGAHVRGGAIRGHPVAATPPGEIAVGVTRPGAHRRLVNGFLEAGRERGLDDHLTSAGYDQTRQVAPVRNLKLRH